MQIRSSHRQESGLTLIEMLIVAPLVILLIGTSIGYISSLTGQGLQTRQKNALTYTAQASLDDIEQSANLATGFLPFTTSTDVVSPQGRDNANAQFIANSGGSAGTLILRSAATTKNPNDPTRALIYTGSGACNENNALYTYLTIYFVSNNQLIKRTVLSRTAACATPYQQNSCAQGYGSGSCTVKDEKLADDVSDFSINYLFNNAASAPENADTVVVSVTLTKTAAGQPISYTGKIRSVTINQKADTGQAATTPTVTGSISTTSAANPDIFTCSWDAVGNASSYSVRYRYNAEPWINGPQNTTQTSYSLNVNAQRGKSITCDVTANTTSGSVAYTPDTEPIPLWTTCLLENGWVNYGSPYAVAAFYKSPSNIVSLKGLVRSGTTTQETRICKLPTGYWPDSRLVFQVSRNGSTSGRIDIQTDGTVTVVFADAGWTNLSGITYPTSGASWTTLSSSTGWTDVGSPYPIGMRVTKDSNGKAYMQGVVKGGTNTAGTTMYTMPAGYSTDQNLYLVSVTGGATATVNLNTTNITSRGVGSGYWSFEMPFYPTGSTTWQAPTLANGWVDYGGGWTTSRYTKSPNGIVTLSGLIRSGTVTNGTTIATLPSGYRPSETIICSVDTASNAYARIDIAASGAIIAREGVQNGYLSLAGCDFMADGN